jgi:hypothetical protein
MHMAELSPAEAKDLGAKMAAAVKEHIARALAPIATRLSAVEARTGALSMLLGKGEAAGKIGALEAFETRIKALEARPSMSYRGVWEEGERNLPGDVCTHDGSMWHCWRATKDRPGTSDAWQLCVKHGRDAR